MDRVSVKKAVNRAKPTLEGLEGPARKEQCTLIALAAEAIVVDRHSALGPVDPQLGNQPAASILATVERPGDHDDETLILSDVARKAIVQPAVEYVPGPPVSPTLPRRRELPRPAKGRGRGA